MVSSSLWVWRKIELPVIWDALTPMTHLCNGSYIYIAFGKQHNGKQFKSHETNIQMYTLDVESIVLRLMANYTDTKFNRQQYYNMTFTTHGTGLRGSCREDPVSVDEIYSRSVGLWVENCNGQMLVMFVMLVYVHYLHFVVVVLVWYRSVYMCPGAAFTNMV